jgi:hypothetical protein
MPTGSVIIIKSGLLHGFSHFAQPKRCGLLADDDALRLEVQLNCLRPPTDLGSSRKQVLGEMYEKTFAEFGRRLSG